MGIFNGAGDILRSVPVRIIIWGLLTITLVLAITNIYGYIMQDPDANSLCSSCHIMEPFIKAVNATPHGEFNCHKCHEPPGINVLLGALMNTPTPEELKSRAGREINMFDECIQCHELGELLEMSIHSSHINIVEKIGSCDVCHDPHAISNNIFSCLTCHDQDRAVKRHALFHREAIEDLQMGNVDVCTECHNPNSLAGPGICDESIKGSLEGLTCFDCHQPPLEDPDISGYTCQDCHDR